MSSGFRGPTSPFRYALAPEGGATRHVPCSREVTALRGAKQGAGQWTEDVGRGTITVEERVSDEWKAVVVADVRKGELGKWR